MLKKKAYPNPSNCVACGLCYKVCPRSAIEIYKGCYAKVDLSNCVGCGICAKSCPTGTITIKEMKEEGNE